MLPAMTKAADKIIVALDVATKEKALELVDQLRGEISFFEIGLTDAVEYQILRLAKLGAEAGIDGVVASPREIKPLRREFGDRIKIAVQGIRPSWAEPDDQKRFMSPREAIQAGADYIGIGRPITGHARPPREAVKMILDEVHT